MASEASPACAHAHADFNLLRQTSIEISPREAAHASLLRAHLPRGTRVHVTFLPNTEYTQTVAACCALAREGFTPVPHIAARSLASSGALDDYASRLAGEAGVRHVLLIGGDLDHPRGPFPDTMSVLRTGVLQRYGVTSVAFAGHPEGHPAVPSQIVEDALFEKLRYARENDLDATIITQLCFEAQPIVTWLERVRAAGVSAPVWIGMAAPTNPIRLARFAARCGVGPSLRALTTQRERLGRLLANIGPAALIAELEHALHARDSAPDIGIAGVHFFVFSAPAKVAEWLAAQRKQRS